MRSCNILCDQIRCFTAGINAAPKRSFSWNLEQADDLMCSFSDHRERTKSKSFIFDIDPAEADMTLMGRRVRLGHKVFPGDAYSNGASARPLFCFDAA